MRASALPQPAAVPQRRAMIRAAWHPLTLLLLTFLCNTLLWALVMPPNSAPDEQAHFEYIQHLALRHTLPIYGQTTSTANPQALNPEAMQPPLYYLLATPLALLLQGQPAVWQYAGLRAVSALLGALTVAVSYMLGRALAPERPLFALVLATLIAFNPMFMYMSAAINNDNLVNLIYAALLLMFWHGVQQQRVSRAWLVGLGVLLGAGLLAKLSILTGCAASAVVIIGLALRQPQQRGRALIRYGLWAGVPALLVGGWLLVRNWLLYGDPTTLLIFSNYPDLYLARGYHETGSLWEMLTAARASARFWPGLLYGFWGIFDFYKLWISQRYYLILTTLLLGGAAGALLAGVLAWRRRHNAVTRQRLLFGGVCALLIVLVVWSNISRSYQIDYQPQGRYLFPVLLPLALMVLVGWQRLAWNATARKLVAVILVALVLAANAVALGTGIMSVYRDKYARAVLDQLPAEAQPVYGSFAVTSDFTAQQPTIEHLDVLLDVAKQGKQPLIFRLQRADAPQTLATGVLARPDSGLTRFRIDVSFARFVVGERYRLVVQAPWTTADHAAKAYLSAANAPDDARLRIAYTSDLRPPSVAQGAALLRTVNAGTLQGSVQQALCVVVLLLMLGFALVVGRGLGGAAWAVLSFCAPLLAVLLLAGPLLSVPQQTRIATQDVAAVPGAPLTLDDQSGQYADLILLSGSPAAQKSPPDDPAQQISIIQPYRFTIGDDTRPVLTMQPPAAITYTLQLPQHAVLKTALALNPQVWQPDKGDGVIFVVDACVEDGCRELLRQEIDPKQRVADRRWHDVALDLRAWGGQTVQLVLRTLPGPAGDGNYDWAGWGAPVIVTLPYGSIHIVTPHNTAQSTSPP